MQNADQQRDTTVGLKGNNVAPVLFYHDILPFNT
jgi:hypothetical protein